MFNPINFTGDSHVFGRGVAYGGGGKAPKMPADNSMDVERLRIQQANEERQRQEARTLEDRDRFNTRRTEAVGAANTTAQQALQSRGLDATRYMSPLSAEIARISSSIPDLDPNPGQYFDPSFVEGVLGREQTAARDRAGRGVRQQFGEGFELRDVPDSLDDTLLSSILETQYGTARDTIDRARQRGDLNDAGMNAAMSGLGTAKSGAQSQLTGIGDTVLSRYRDELKGVSGRANTGANTWELGDPDFSLDPYTQEYGTTKTRQSGALEGDVRGAVGGTQFFDINQLLDQGARVGGPTSGNPGDDFIYSALASQNKKKNATDRGVGSGGVF